MRTASLVAFAACVPVLMGEVHKHGGGTILPHDKYIHVVPESASPVEQVYIKSKDGLYIAAAIRKPRGKGPFPVLVYFHGAPGGRGMEKLVTWSRGDTGGPLWERFLQEGFAVVVADYRNTVTRADDFVGRLAERVTYADDGVSVLDYVRSRPEMDAKKVVVYGVSRGGSVALHTVARSPVAAVILGAPAPAGFIGAEAKTGGGYTIDEALATRNVAAITTPVLILVGTEDRLLELAHPLHDRLAAAGKIVRLDIYEKGYHDFVAGPQGHEGRAEPLMDITMQALDLALEWARKYTR